MIDPVMPTYTRTPLRFTSGSGSWLTEADGRRFLDLGAGIAVNALGHAHPQLVEALTQQAQQLWHVSNLYEIPAQQTLAQMLVDLTFADTVFFTNSGTEAAELAIKMARKFGAEHGRSRILTFEGAFHGRSIAAISAAGSDKLTDGFAPLLPGFTHLPWNDMPAVTAAAAAPDVAAIMIEPIQGEGGIRVLPDQMLRQLRQICDENNLLLILDEVQCGMGRTGKLFAHEWAGITPDIMMSAKGIGGGFPLGAVLATQKAAAPMTPGSHGSTYGGNPLACAVGATALGIISDTAFLDDISHKAGQLNQGLAGLVDSHPDIFESPRGVGLMAGLKCRVPAAGVIDAARDQNLLTVPAADNVVRLLPPLTISEPEIREALARLERAAASLSSE